MPLIPDGRVLYAQALREHFAAPAFNVCNLEMAPGAVEAAEAEEAPIILQTYPGDLAHGGAPLATLLRTLAEGSSAPVALHLDHGEGLEMIAGRLRDGYSSVMFDGSHLDLDENIRQTRRLAEVAHAFSVSLEAEIGLFGGDHGSVVFTDPEEAERFVFESGADNPGRLRRLRTPSTEPPRPGAARRHLGAHGASDGAARWIWHPP